MAPSVCFGCRTLVKMKPCGQHCARKLEAPLVDAVAEAVGIRSSWPFSAARTPAGPTWHARSYSRPVTRWRTDRRSWTCPQVRHRPGCCGRSSLDRRCVVGSNLAVITKEQPNGRAPLRLKRSRRARREDPASPLSRWGQGPYVSHEATERGGRIGRAGRCRFRGRVPNYRSGSGGAKASKSLPGSMERIASCVLLCSEDLGPRSSGSEPPTWIKSELDQYRVFGECLRHCVDVMPVKVAAKVLDDMDVVMEGSFPRLATPKLSQAQTCASLAGRRGQLASYLVSVSRYGQCWMSLLTPGMHLPCAHIPRRRCD